MNIKVLNLIKALVVILFSINATAQYSVKPASIRLAEVEANETIYSEIKKNYTVIWEETFNGELPASWQNVNLNDFCEFKHTYTGPQGPFSTEIPSINSTTASNGFMILDSDYCNWSDGEDEYQLVDAYIESPAIDLTGYHSVGLHFEHFYRYCCDFELIELNVLVSHNGIDWVKYDVRNSLPPNNTSTNPVTTVLNISAVAGDKETVYLRFHKEGASQYFWMIDDVSIISLIEDDVELSEIRFGGYSIIPEGVKSNINLSGLVKNIGGTVQNDVQLSVSVNEYLGPYQSNITPVLNPSSQVVLETLENFVIPGKGIYNFDFHVSQKQTDQFPDNNHKNATIIVSDTIFARDTGNYSPGELVWPAQYQITHTGNLFEIENEVLATSISLALHENTLPGVEISAVLFEVSEQNIFTEISRSEAYEITQEDINIEDKQLVLLTLDVDDVMLNENGIYLAAVEYSSNDVAIAADNAIWQPAGTSFSKVEDIWVVESATPIIRLNFGSNIGDCEILAHFEIMHDFCEMGNGSILAVPVSGTPPFTFHWDTDPVVEEAFIDGLSAGTYNLTITDSHNCIDEFEVEVEAQEIDIIIEVVPSACGGANGIAIVTPVNGIAPFSYLWGTEPEQTDSIAVGLLPGTYTVTVTDANGCAVDDEVVVNSINSVTLAYEAIEPVCMNDNGNISVTPITGTPPFAYDWSNDPDHELSFMENLDAGNYIISVTDDDACLGVLNIDLIAEDYDITIFGNIIHTSCEMPNGSVLLNVTNGQMPFEFIWSNGTTDKDLLDVYAGEYSVVVTDEWGCAGEKSFVINNSGDAIEVEIIITDTSACGEDDGSIEVIPLSEEADYSYLWESGETDPLLEGLSSGVYVLTVFDNLGVCQDEFEIAISDGGLPEMTVNKKNVTCYGADDGSISISISGNDFDFLWNTGSTENFISNLTPGLYHVYITSEDCYAYFEFTITEPEVLEIKKEFVQINPLCFDEASGSIEIQAIGGTSPYQFLWDNQMTGSLISDLAAGDYTVTVTDDNECTDTENYTLIEPEEIIIIAEVVNPDHGENNGSIEVTVLNAIGEVTYTWDSGHSGAYITGLDAGSYTVTVNDENGCSAEETFDLFSTFIYNPSYTESISIYPNPAKDILFVDFGELSEYKWDMHLYNIKGFVVMHVKKPQNLGITKINLQNLTNGLYILQIKSDIGSFEKVIIVN